MKILFVSSELFPFAKTGGLADVVSSLANELSLMGHEVKIVLPRYSSINAENFEKVDGILKIKAANGDAQCSLYKTILPSSNNVEVYFIEHEGCFALRQGIYGNKNEKDFFDNPYRFTLLSRGAFEVCNFLNWIPDIIHCHDWSSSLSAVLLKYVYRYENFSNTASVLTIHNLGYQGIYPLEKFTDLGIDWGLYYKAGFDYKDRFNFLKAGIICADELTTVSPTYAEEIQTQDYGFGLNEFLYQRSSCLTGILNGEDKKIWNPETDSLIPFNYSKDNLENKAKCKKVLQKQFGLAPEEKVPLVGLVMRLADQKGINELYAPGYGCFSKMCEDLNAQFVIVGSGEAWCENAIKNLCAKYSNVRAMIGYEEKLSHLVEAGSDLFLLPSKYEPCGLNQIYSMAYGTLPIVRKTGGLADTVNNFDEKNNLGTGFVFDLLSPSSIYHTVEWAVDTYLNKQSCFKALQQRAMSSSFTWENSAKQYVEVYKKALNSI